MYIPIILCWRHNPVLISRPRFYLHIVYIHFSCWHKQTCSLPHLFFFLARFCACLGMVRFSAPYFKNNRLRLCTTPLFYKWQSHVQIINLFHVTGFQSLPWRNSLLFFSFVSVHFQAWFMMSYPYHLIYEGKKQRHYFLRFMRLSWTVKEFNHVIEC